MRGAVAVAITLLVYGHVQFMIADVVRSSLVQQPKIKGCWDPSSDWTVCDNDVSQMAALSSTSLLQNTRRLDKRARLVKRESTSKLKIEMRDVLLYDHLGKAGGSFIRSVLEDPKVIAPEYVKILREDQGVTADDRQRTFTVGSVRNPCEYYVSCWAFGGKLDAWTQRHGNYSFYNTSMEYYGVTDDLNTPEDRLRFQKWLRWILPLDVPPGLITARMLWSYANESVASAQMPEPTLQGWSDADRQVYYKAMLAFDVTSIDCWIRTEKLTDDLQVCLQRFEAGAADKLVNWVEFNKTVAQRKREHQTFNWTTGTDHGEHSDATDTYVWTKRTGHEPCDFYFDDSSKEYILKTDSMVFEKFGYQTCCQPASSD